MVGEVKFQDEKFLYVDFKDSKGTTKEVKFPL